MILVDADILIDFLREKQEAKNFLNEHSGKICVSIFTEMELIAGCTDKAALSKIKTFLDKFTILDANKDAVRLGARLFEKHRLGDSLGYVDALIAGTAVSHHLTLYGRNEKHYRRLEGLKYIKPY
ncbi:MAG: type II toxin-antitoxin system VapC family toxin [Spirochaetia bacterium]|nr:type II toxin-antitoxin system VapC family toxin [Spirochaetia bacterium]